MSYFGSIYADQELSHRAKTVYMYLKDRSNADGTCWPSVRRIAEDLKLSHRAAGLGGLGAAWIFGAHASPPSKRKSDQQFLPA